MKKGTLRQLTQAHGWLGIIISSLLFLVFLAGSISLFRDEILIWAVQPIHQSAEGPQLSSAQIMERAIQGRAFNAKEHLSVVPPSDSLPYYRVYVDLIEEQAGREYIPLLMDPVSGEVVGEIDKFFLADFIYFLHYNMNIPFGDYLIGFITLFFFFMLLSGVVIHARKLFRNFFQYRSESNQRSQLLDMHNVIGTVSLPFTLMYAITGLIFNLVIIYQIAFALVLYKGDQQALLTDAGYHDPHPEWHGKPVEHSNIDNLVNQYGQKYQSAPYVVRLYNYGDESAVLHLIGEVEGYFFQRYETAIRLSDESVIFTTDMNQNNKVRQGLAAVAKLHFGSYANMDLRFVYLLLGLLVCGLIVTGNLLWIEKREKNQQSSPRSAQVMRYLNFVCTSGLIGAISVGFLFERILPPEMTARQQWMVYSFVFTLAGVAMISPLLNKVKALPILLTASAIVLLLTIICDWMMYSDNLILHWQQQHYTIFAMEAGIGVMALILLWVARSLKRQSAPKTKQVHAVELATEH